MLTLRRLAATIFTDFSTQRKQNMKLAPELCLAVCLIVVTSTHAAVKKATLQDLKKVLDTKKSEQAPPSFNLQPPMPSEDAKPSTEVPTLAKMSYIDSTNFRQVVSPVLETSTEVFRSSHGNIHYKGDEEDEEVETSTETSHGFSLEREHASANLKAIPHVEFDRNSRFTTSIVFGFGGGSDGYGF